MRAGKGMGNKQDPMGEWVK